MTQGAPVLAGTSNTATQLTDITLQGPDIGLSVRAGNLPGSGTTAWAAIAAGGADPGAEAVYAIGRGRGVYAVGLEGEGVYGFSHRTYGVMGNTLGPNQGGVFGLNNATGQGVVGYSEGGIGVLGRTNNTESVAAGVQGDHLGGGPGVVGTSTRGIGVSGRTDGGSSPVAILGENASGNREGVAVVALGGAGVGVHASGARAAIVLEPQSTQGAPTTGSHSMGEMLVDSQGDLFLCKASGTPGTWVQVA
jgi:hypothetical protein